MSKELTAFIERQKKLIEALEFINSDNQKIRDKNEVKIRLAIVRLLEGKPTKTDGSLTNANLHEESDVPRASLYRAQYLLKEWKEGVCIKESTKESIKDIDGLSNQIIEWKEKEKSWKAERQRLLHIQEILIQRLQAATLFKDTPFVKK